MADVTLSAAVRASLLSLQGTTRLINQTQDRLSSGLRVASAIDDPVAFFQAKTLSDRAGDFNEKKDAIDQGISSLTAAVDGMEAIEAVVRQMKGIAESMKSATNTQLVTLVSQFNDLRTQIDNLSKDANYQGTNLINSTSTTLTVAFSTLTASRLSVTSVDVSVSGANGLTVSAVSTATTIAGLNGTTVGFTFASGSNVILRSSATLALTFAGASALVLTGTSGGRFLTVTYGAQSIVLGIVSGQSVTLSGGQRITLDIFQGITGAGTDQLSGAGAGAPLGIILSTAVGSSTTSALTIGDVAKVENTLNVAASSTAITNAISQLDADLATIRSETSKLATNVALLNTRLDFTEQYVNTLEDGSSKLTLADINEEGANLLALQTRQQLGITALSFAGQAEQGILALFR